MARAMRKGSIALITGDLSESGTGFAIAVGMSVPLGNVLARERQDSRAAPGAWPMDRPVPSVQNANRYWTALLETFERPAQALCLVDATATVSTLIDTTGLSRFSVRTVWSNEQ